MLVDINRINCGQIRLVKFFCRKSGRLRIKKLARVEILGHKVVRRETLRDRHCGHGSQGHSGELRQTLCSGPLIDCLKSAHVT